MNFTRDIIGASEASIHIILSEFDIESILMVIRYFRAILVRKLKT